jgi:threonine dehydrogenase-like Zn-dependent dehydrogenase
MMKAAIFKGKGAIELGERPDPTIKEPTDAVVRVVRSCVCGSDLWYYRGESDYPVGSPIGHEFLGVVEHVGESVQTIAQGNLVIAAKRFGAQRIIALSRIPARQELARAFGATDIEASRGKEASEAVLSLTDGVGVDAALECVGTNEAMQTALAIARPGSIVGYVGVPHGVEIPVPTLFYRNVGAHGGPAPARAYIPELLDDVLEGHINPGRVFDFTTDLGGIAQAYAAMDERRAIKSLVKVGTV